MMSAKWSSSRGCVTHQEGEVSRQRRRVVLHATGHLVCGDREHDQQRRRCGLCGGAAGDSFGQDVTRRTRVALLSIIMSTPEAGRDVSVSTGRCRSLTSRSLSTCLSTSRAHVLHSCLRIGQSECRTTSPSSSTGRWEERGADSQRAQVSRSSMCFTRSVHSPGVRLLLTLMVTEDPSHVTVIHRLLYGSAVQTPLVPVKLFVAVPSQSVFDHASRVKAAARLA